MTTQFAMPEEELAALVAEVAAGIRDITKKEAERNTRLRKSAEGEEPSEGSEGGESAGGPPGGGESAPAGDPSASAGEPPMGDPSASAGGPPPDASAGGPPAGDPAAEGGAPADDGAGAAPSVEDLTQLYAQLPDDQLQAHFVAIQQAVAQRQGAGAGPEAPPADPSAGAGAPPPAAPPAGPSAPPAPAMKSESEKALELKVETLSKSVETLVGAMTAPMRKSVTRVEGNIVYVPYQGGVAQVQAGTPMKKSMKEMSRSEIHERLIEVTRDPKLTKSDRDLINDFYDRKVTVDKLEKFFQ